MIWNEKIETMPLEELKNLQSERLAKLVSYVYENCSVYKQKLDTAGIGPGDIKSRSGAKSSATAISSSRAVSAR